MKNLEYSPLDVAYHEIGHAIAQATLGVGPSEIVVFRKNGGWEGQSKLFERSVSEGNWARIYATQLAGPIAQIVCAPESLSEYRQHFGRELLLPALELEKSDKSALERLCWIPDLGRILNGFARVRDVRMMPKHYEEGVFLHHVERCLFDLFDKVEIRGFVTVVAEDLATSEKIDGVDFQKRFEDSIDGDVLKPIRGLNLDFDPPF